MAALQRRLVQLRYLSPGMVNGRLDYRTPRRCWHSRRGRGSPRTGDANLATRQRATWRGSRVPRVPAPVRRIEVNRYKGVALLIERGVVKRAIHVSTGAGGSTPRGTFHIFRKERMSFSRPFSVWLPYASYFSGGYAFHEYPNVPAYWASHGCIRVGYPEAPTVYAFASFGTLVRSRRAAAGLTTLLALAAAAPAIGAGTQVRIADTGTSATRLAAEAVAQALTAQGFAVTRSSAPSAAAAEAATRLGNVDVYMTETATLLERVLARPKERDDARLRSALTTLLAARSQAPRRVARYDDAPQVACTPAAVRVHKLTRPALARRRAPAT